MPNWLGDFVMATPILKAIKKKFPKATLTAMCKSPLGDLLKEDSTVDEVFSFQKKGNPFSLKISEGDVVHKIREGKYDLGILLTNSFSSAWWFWLGKVKTRVGFLGHFRSLFLNKGLKSSQNRCHQVEKYQELLLPFGIEEGFEKPYLVLTEEEKKEAKEILFQRGYEKGNLLVGINPGAAYGSSKCWPKERFRILAKRLSERGIYVVFFGDHSLHDLCLEICQGLSSHVLNVSGLTSLRELACLIEECSLFITNDSGPMHIADALKTDLIALFGSTDEVKTGPFSSKDAVIRKNVSCSPCFKRECPIDFRCMKQISVEEVYQKVLQKLCLEPSPD